MRWNKIVYFTVLGIGVVFMFLNGVIFG